MTDAPRRLENLRNGRQECLRYVRRSFLAQKAAFLAVQSTARQINKMNAIEKQNLIRFFASPERASDDELKHEIQIARPIQSLMESFAIVQIVWN